MSTIADALRHIKGNLTQVLPPSLPDKICRALGQSYRHRTLTPAVTTYLFLQQILHGNPAGHELRHLSKIDFTDSAYCQARGRLTAGYFHLLMREVTGRCYGDDDFDLDPRTRWKGHRLFLIDGSTFSMPGERKGVRNRFRLAVSSHKRFLTPFLAAPFLAPFLASFLAWKTWLTMWK
jgi:hypothetical protein